MNCLFCNKLLNNVTFDYYYCNNTECKYICRFLKNERLGLEINNLYLEYNFLTNQIKIYFEDSVKEKYIRSCSLEELKQIFLNYESNLIFM
jgi:hypothetical protein